MNHVGQHAANLAVVQASFKHNGFLRREPHFNRSRAASVRGRRQADSRHGHVRQVLLRQPRRGRNPHHRRFRSLCHLRLIPLIPLRRHHAQRRARKNQQRRAPGRVSGKLPRHPRKRMQSPQRGRQTPRGLLRRFQIVEGFFQLAPAARQQQSPRVELFRGLLARGDVLLQLLFAPQRRRAIRAAAEVRFHRAALELAQLLANVKQQQRRNVRAGPGCMARIAFGNREWILIAHNNSSSCVRSFRVARNSEFFTVSSVVPSASPMARSFNPW